MARVFSFFDRNADGFISQQSMLHRMEVLFTYFISNQNMYVFGCVHIYTQAHNSSPACNIAFVVPVSAYAQKIHTCICAHVFKRNSRFIARKYCLVIYVFTYIHMHIHILYVRICIYVFRRMEHFLCIYIYIHKDICVYIYIYIYVCM